MSTCIRTYRYTDIETYKHTDIQISRLTYIHTYLHTYIHTDIQISRLTYIHTYKHTDIQISRLTYIHTYVHTYMDTWIHGYIGVVLKRIYTYMGVTSADMAVCLCRGGERPRKRRKVRERSVNTTIYTKYARENMVIIPCPDSAGTRKWSRKRGVKAVLGNHNFEQPQITNIHTYRQTYTHTGHTNIHAYTQTHVHTYIHIYTYMHTCIHAYTVTYLLKLTYPATDRPS